MSLPLEKLLEETFADLGSLSQEKMQALLKETMKTFTDLQEKLASDDPKVREAALQAALDLKDTLMGQVDSLSEKIGVNPEELSSQLSQEEWSDAGAIKAEMDAFRDKFASPQAPLVKKGKKKPATWIAG